MIFGIRLPTQYQKYIELYFGIHSSKLNLLQALYIRSILKNELRLSVIEIDDSDAILEGGNVLFTGQ